MITSWVGEILAHRRGIVVAPLTAWRAGYTAVRKGANLEGAVSLAVYALFRNLR
jgi:hypothetical protein